MEPTGHTINRLQTIINNQKRELQKLNSMVEGSRKYAADMEASSKHWWGEAHRLANGRPIRHRNERCRTCFPGVVAGEDAPSAPFVSVAKLGALAGAPEPASEPSQVFRRAT